MQLARGHVSVSLTQSLFQDSSHSPSEYALALYSALWAFDGWDQANYVGGEMKNATKNIPRAIHSSMAIVTVRKLIVSKAVILTYPLVDPVSSCECLIFCGAG